MPDNKPDNKQVWDLIHAERARLAETLGELTPEQWATPSLCAGWTVGQLAAHVVQGAEQTSAGFFAGMARAGFRFNTMMQQSVARLAQVPQAELVERLQARTTTTNRPPAPPMAMLGEVVVHGEDIRRPLGITAPVTDDAVNACLDMYTTASFPVGGRKRIAGLRLVAPDTGWSYGTGPEVNGPGRSVMLAMTGRKAGVPDLTGDGAAVLAQRVG